MRANRNEPESARFWFQGLKVGRMAASSLGRPHAPPFRPRRVL
jgi:hypothetical protein